MEFSFPNPSLSLKAKLFYARLAFILVLYNNNCRVTALPISKNNEIEFISQTITPTDQGSGNDVHEEEAMMKKLLHNGTVIHGRNREFDYTEAEEARLFYNALSLQPATLKQPNPNKASNSGGNELPFMFAYTNGGDMQAFNWSNNLHSSQVALAQKNAVPNALDLKFYESEDFDTVDGELKGVKNFVNSRSKRSDGVKGGGIKGGSSKTKRPFQSTSPPASTTTSTTAIPTNSTTTTPSTTAIPTNPTVPSTTGIPTNPTTTTPSTTTTIEAPIFDCSGLEDGNYPHPEDCNKFVSCVAGKYLYIRDCPADLHYDPRRDRCEYPWLAGCDSPLTTTKEPTVIPTNPTTPSTTAIPTTPSFTTFPATASTAAITLPTTPATATTESPSSTGSFNTSTADPSGVTSSASTSTCATSYCSSGCDLWPWLLFLIFLCLLILFMLMFLQCYISKLLTTRIVSGGDTEFVNSSSGTSTKNKCEQFDTKGDYLETFAQNTSTGAKVMESQTSFPSSRHVSSSFKVDSDGVLVNEKVQKSLDYTTKSKANQNSLWNMDKDFLTSSGRTQNQYSYVEYKEIPCTRPRPAIYNVTSSTAEAGHQKKDGKKLEVIPAADINSDASQSSAKILTTSTYNIKPDKASSICSDSEKMNAGSGSNEINDLTASSSASKHGPTILTIPTTTTTTTNQQMVSENYTRVIVDQPKSCDTNSKIPISQQANDNKTNSQTRKTEVDKLKRDFFNISDNDNVNLMSARTQYHSFVGTYNRLQKRLEIERQRSKSGEKISNYNNNIGTSGFGESVSNSSTTTITAVSTKSVDSSPSTKAFYNTYSKKKGTGETVLIVNKEEGWFKLETGSTSPGNVTKVHRIIQIDSKKSTSSSDCENDMDKLYLSSGTVIDIDL